MCGLRCSDAIDEAPVAMSTLMMEVLEQHPKWSGIVALARVVKEKDAPSSLIAGPDR